MPCGLASCSKHGADLLRCSGCKLKDYCSVECSTADWKEHKRVCRSASAASALRTLQAVAPHVPGTVCPPPGMVEVQKCAWAPCDKHSRITGVVLRKCAACELIVYCSNECRDKDWPVHKPECKAAKEAKAALAAQGIFYVQVSRGDPSCHKTCCLCGKDAGRFGHNPAPLGVWPSVACDDCNATRVYPARMA